MEKSKHNTKPVEELSWFPSLNPAYPRVKEMHRLSAWIGFQTSSVISPQLTGQASYTPWLGQASHTPWFCQCCTTLVLLGYFQYHPTISHSPGFSHISESYVDFFLDFFHLIVMFIWHILPSVWLAQGRSEQTSVHSDRTPVTEQRLIPIASELGVCCCPSQRLKWHL